MEDIQLKAEAIISYIKEVFQNIEIDRKESYNAAIKTIYNDYDKYDVILLDMSMSTFDISIEESGGVPEPIAGRRILDGMFLRDIQTKVIVVTMYENFDGVKLKELDESLHQEYPDNYYDYVYFSFQKDDWKEKLKTHLNNILYDSNTTNG